MAGKSNRLILAALVVLVTAVSAQEKDLQSGKANPSYQSLTSQTLDSDLNRDGAYAPANSYGGNDYGYEAHADSYSSGGSYGDDKLGGFVTALTAFLPIGLFLAAVVPNIITVSSGRRRRSNDPQDVKDEVTFPILDMISSYGMRSLQEPSCQAKITCEMGAMGGMPEANGVQRALWIGANFVPERVARVLGVDRLIHSIQKRDCAQFACGSK